MQLLSLLVLSITMDARRKPRMPSPLRVGVTKLQCFGTNAMTTNDSRPSALRVEVMHLEHSAYLTNATSKSSGSLPLLASP